MTAPTGTANRPGCGAPHVVVMMGFADQRMRDLMEKRVVDLLCRGVPGKFIRQGDHLRVILTTARACAAVIELETPQREVMLLQQLARLLGNRAQLERSLAGSAASVLACEGGWYAVVRLPDVADEDAWVLGLLERKLATHPGYYYDFAAGSPHLVLSLLPPPEVFARGAEILRQEVDRRTRQP